MRLWARIWNLFKWKTQDGITISHSIPFGEAGTSRPEEEKTCLDCNVRRKFHDSTDHQFREFPKEAT